MFVFSVKMTRRRVLSAVIGAVALAAVLVTVLCLPPAQSTVGSTPKLSAATAEERIALLNELGYKATVDSETVQEIRLPDEADAVLSAYEELQTAGGLSLLKHSGKRVKLYTYAVIDTVGAKAQAHLYVYRGRVIAGDITAADPDGTQSPLLA